MLLLLFISSKLHGQVYTCSFNYSEQLVTDYTGIMSQGKSSAIRKDSSQHQGIISWKFLQKDSLCLQIITTVYTTTIPVKKNIPVISLLVALDENGRIDRLLLNDSAKQYIPHIQAWLGEMNFILPHAQGQTEERKVDGLYRIDYAVQQTGDRSVLQKTNPVYDRGVNNKLAIVSDKYTFNAVFGGAQQVLTQLSFSERKRQVMARRILACIDRNLLVNQVEKGEDFFCNPDNATPVMLYPAPDADKRKMGIAQTQLGTNDLHSLSALLPAAPTLTAEEQFRLSGKFRSLLIVDSNKLKEVVQLFDMQPKRSLQADILRNAIIESRIPASVPVIINWLQNTSGDYESLKDVVIRISMADAGTPSIARVLQAILESGNDKNSRYLLELALANYAATIRESRRDEYVAITNTLHEQYRLSITDTAQFLFVVGNAGMEAASARIIPMLESADTTRTKEVMFALRNIHTPLVDSIVLDYLLRNKPAADLFALFLDKRETEREFYQRLSHVIVDADKSGNTNAIGALQYILDNAWTKALDLSLLQQHVFSQEVYQREMSDFIRQSAICQ